MDNAALSAQDFALVLAQLAQVNALTLAHRPTLAFLKSAVKTKRFRLLDVGFGQGDMLRRIATWAKGRGLDATLVGIDLNPNGAPAARAVASAHTNIDYRTGDYATLSEPFDFVISSLVTHHMTHEQLITFLRFMDRRAQIGWFVNDLHRHRAASVGFSVLARLMRWHPIVCHDGKLSIAKSFRPHDWTALLAEAGVKKARVFRAFPFRLCVESVPMGDS
jgi:2-polyprenyl-3-methyl-5-hydroxy-6-metoxy-1,4-benzoquinol methylase